MKAYIKLLFQREDGKVYLKNIIIYEYVKDFCVAF